MRADKDLNDADWGPDLHLFLQKFLSFQSRDWTPVIWWVFLKPREPHFRDAAAETSDQFDTRGVHGRVGDQNQVAATGTGLVPVPAWP